MVAVFFGICLFCALYTIYRVVGQSSYPKKQKVRISLFFLISFLLPFLLRYKGDFSGFLYDFVCLVGYFCFIVVSLFFGLIFLRDIIWFFLSFYEKIKKKETRRFGLKNPSFLRKTNRVFFVLSAAICVYSLYAGLKTPDVKEATFISDRIEKPITVAVIGDLHLTRSSNVSKVKRIVDAVNVINPDFVVLPGDTIDDKIKFIAPHLAELKKLNAEQGVYAVAGNHEFYVGHDESKKAFETSGITYLFNEGISLKNNVYLAGIPDMKTAKYISETVDLQKAFRNANDHEFKILVSHRPSIVDQLMYQKVDFVVAGHTHGGQIFPFHIISRIMNGFLAGSYKEDGTMLYVTRGAGQWGPQMRFLAPSEISVIKILPYADEAARQSDVNGEGNSATDKVLKPTAEEVKKALAPLTQNDETIVYPVTKPQTPFVEVAQAEKEDLKQTAVLEQLKEAQEDADAEASKTEQSQEQVQEESVDAFEEAKAAISASFENTLLLKAQEDLKIERSKNKKLQIELNQLRIDFEKSQTNADKIILRQKAALKILEDEREALKQSLNEHKELLKQEQKAAKEAIANQKRLLAREQELSKQAFRLQKALLKELASLKQQLDSHKKFQAVMQEKKKLYVQVPVNNNKMPAQVMAQPTPVKSDFMYQDEQRREEKFANMEVIYHPNGQVTRQMTKTVVVEYPTHISALKSVASYTTTREEEMRTNPVVIENALRQALNLPTSN